MQEKVDADTLTFLTEGLVINKAPEIRGCRRQMRHVLPQVIELHLYPLSRGDLVAAASTSQVGLGK